MRIDYGQSEKLAQITLCFDVAREDEESAVDGPNPNSITGAEGDFYSVESFFERVEMAFEELFA